MQTFLPYSNIVESLKILDNKRLGKQRVEAMQIARIVAGITPNSRWKKHPAVLMWEGYPEGIWYYMNCAINEWVARGKNNTMTLVDVPDYFFLPEWLGDERFHSSHRSNLLRKDFSYYGEFGWEEDGNLPYFWPTKEGY